MLIHLELKGLILLVKRQKNGLSRLVRNRRQKLTKDLKLKAKRVRIKSAQILSLKKKLLQLKSK